MTAQDFIDQRIDALSQQSDNLGRKAQLKQTREQLAEQFHAGIPARQLIADTTRFVDALLCQLWPAMLAEKNLALIAVGGYGRGELHPQSDIDLLILCKTAHDPNSDTGQAIHQQIEDFCRNCWDSGLQIGHSVRSIDACVEEASNDLSVITSLIESRLLCGPAALYEQLNAAIATDKMWSAGEFFEAKLAEQRARHARYNDSAYKLEPNIKESPGGLRDLHTIGWVLKRAFGVQSLEQLLDCEFLQPKECADLLAARDTLWERRFALHTQSGRHEDRLLFEHQTALAPKREGDRGNDAVERYMQSYYRAVKELSLLNDMLLQLLEETVLHSESSQQATPLGQRFQLRHGYIEFADKHIPERNPFTLLELFLKLAEHPEIKGVRARTIRLIRNNLSRFNQNLRDDPRSRGTFIEILRISNGVTHVFRRMHRYGVLAAYLPAFEQITGRMQYDMVHVYTVDQHTLMVLRNARRLIVDEFADEAPFAHRLAKALFKPERLYIACLFHDIAKGRGGDHSTLGAQDAREFCQHHGLGSYDTELVAWLVNSHLLMSSTAQRKDLSDPDTIAEFADAVGNEERLTLLYLLTISDIRGTNPNLLNGWRASLLRELYEATRHYLRRGQSEGKDSQRQIQLIRQDAANTLQDSQQIAAAQALWDSLPDDYFLRHRPSEIGWQAQSILDNQQATPMVRIAEQGMIAGSEIFIFDHDRPKLFSDCTAVLAQLGLNILDARIITSRCNQNRLYALNTFIVLDSENQPIEDPDTRVVIEENLEQALRHPETIPDAIHRRPSRQLKQFTTRTRVIISPDPHYDRSIMELVCADRPGLLLQVSQILDQQQIHLTNAKITTVGERTEDVFFITNAQGQALSDPQQIQALEQHIREAL